MAPVTRTLRIGARFIEGWFAEKALALEERAVVGRQEGEEAIFRVLSRGHGLAPFAPPVLVHGSLVIAPTANILLYLAPWLGLIEEREHGRFDAHQQQLTIADLVSEVHDTHHPIAVSLYYEDQKAEAWGAPRARRRGCCRVPPMGGRSRREQRHRADPRAPAFLAA